jgi:hypothetical protein
MAGLNFDDFRELGKFQLDAVTSATNSTAKGWQAFAAEATDYSKRSLDTSRAYFEKLLRAQKLDEVIQIQSEFCQTAYGDFFARASRVGELCSNLAKETLGSAQTLGESATKAATEATGRALSEVGERAEEYVARAQSGGRR